MPTLVSACSRRFSKRRGPSQGCQGGRARRGGVCVLIRAEVLHHDVRHVVLLDLDCQVGVVLDAVLHVLHLDRVQKRMELFDGAKVTDDR